MEEHTLIKDEKENFIYARNNHYPEAERLVDILKARYKAESCLLTSSGMTAIATTIWGILMGCKSCTIYFPKELYCDTPTLFDFFRSQLPERVKLVQFDELELKDLDFSQASEENILFFESCSNPRGFMIPPNWVKTQSARMQCTVVIDNTWLTSAILNPFETHEADFVVLSLAKHYSAGRHIAGAVLQKQRCLTSSVHPWIHHLGFQKQMCHTSSIHLWIHRLGLHVSPVAVKAILDAVSSLDERIAEAGENTEILFNNLSSLWNTRFYHPCASGASLPHWPSQFCFDIKTTKTRALKLIKKSGLPVKTSYGGKDTRIDSFPHKDGEYVRIRVSVGLEWFDEIEKALNTIFESSETKKL